MTPRSLERGIREAFSVVKNEIIVLKESFQDQKDRNSQFEKKIDVLDKKIENIRSDISELNTAKNYVEDIDSLKDDIKSLKKELEKIKKQETPKDKEEEDVKEYPQKEKDYLQYTFWILALALIVFVSLGLYYDWYGNFTASQPEGFFRTFEIEEGGLVKLDVVATDQDDDNLFTSFTGPLNSQGEWQTKAGDKGDYGVTVTVSDGKETVSKVVKIIVE